MKNLLALTVAVAALASLSSCKKDYTCECKYSGTTQNITYKDTKSKAEESCDTYEKTVKMADSNASCELK